MRGDWEFFNNNLRSLMGKRRIWLENTTQEGSGRDGSGADFAIDTQHPGRGQSAILVMGPPACGVHLEPLPSTGPGHFHTGLLTIDVNSAINWSLNSHCSLLDQTVSERLPIFDPAHHHVTTVRQTGNKRPNNRQTEHNQKTNNGNVAGSSTTAGSCHDRQDIMLISLLFRGLCDAHTAMGQLLPLPESSMLILTLPW